MKPSAFEVEVLVLTQTNGELKRYSVQAIQGQVVEDLLQGIGYGEEQRGNLLVAIRGRAAGLGRQPLPSQWPVQPGDRIEISPLVTQSAKERRREIAAQARRRQAEEKAKGASTAK